MKTLIVAILLTFGVNAFGVPVGFRMAPVTYFTNNGVIYFGSNAPPVMVLTNNTTISNATFTVDATGTFTNLGAQVVSNLHQLGWMSSSMRFVGFSAITNDDVDIGDFSILVVTNTTVGDIVITGFSGPVQGRHLKLLNQSGTNCTLLGSSTNSKVGRVTVQYGTSTNIGGSGSAELIYFSTNWHVINISQ